MPPVFVQNVAVFFVVDEKSVGWLYFYTFDNLTMEFSKSLKFSVDTSVDATKTSLIRTTTGVIFKGAYRNLITHYSTTTFAATTLALDTNEKTVGLIDVANLVLR